MKPRRKEKTIKDINPKLYHYEIRTYYNPVEIVQALGSVHRYAYVYHDKDVTPEGLPKQVHYHILVTFVNPRFFGGVDKALTSFFSTKDSDTNYNLLPVGTNAMNSVAKRFRYLRHADDENKHQYLLDDIVSNDKQWYISQEDTTPVSASTTVETNRAFLIDLVTLNSVQLAIRYGRDFIKNFTNYMAFRGHLVATHHDDYAETVQGILDADPDKPCILDTEIGLENFKPGHFTDNGVPTSYLFHDTQINLNKQGETL